MQELKTELDAHISEKMIDNNEADAPNRLLYPELQETAKKWAIGAMNTYEGELLKKALAVSAAICDFNTYKEHK
jgi:hypothetical protein